MRRLILLLAVALVASAADRTRYNFNSDWKVLAGDPAGAAATGFSDASWWSVALPNGQDLNERVVWYRKHFKLPAGSAGEKVFLEFEGIRDSGEVYLNGKSIGRREAASGAFGFDITAAVKPSQQENVLAMRLANKDGYCGIPGNVWLHITSKLHQTLPLYSSLGSTGVYIYAQDFDIAGQTARVTAEAQVKNDFDTPRTFTYEAVIRNVEGKTVATLDGGSHTLRAGESAVVSATGVVKELRFWSWGYGYLYTVATILKVSGQAIDTVATRTGFRKTEFAKGAMKLNDRAIQLKGYVQPTPNGWPDVGPSTPPWLSDFSNRLIVEGNGNLTRWNPEAPAKQDVESCDRVGLMETLPADRLESMRDAIVYNRNNPSIVFYEAGGEAISEDQMRQMKAVRDQFDPHGGRLVGAPGLVESAEAEYSGQLAMVDKSDAKPLWATGYFIDISPGARSLMQMGLTSSDMSADKAADRWFEFWNARPGTGDRVSAGGVSAPTFDPMRIPSDAYFANQVMWEGWVDTERPAVRIAGDWTSAPGAKYSVEVISNSERVELRLNNQSLGNGERSQHFLFTFHDVEWKEGTLQAIAYDASGRRAATARLDSPGPPAYIALNVRTGHNGLMADGADLALVDVEVMDGQNRRCPEATNQIRLSVSGPAELVQTQGSANDGILRVFLRATNQPGRIVLQANSDGLQLGVIDLISRPVAVTSGLSTEPLGTDLMPYLGRGPTPAASSR